MNIEEKKEEVIKKTGELWKKFGKYVYIGVGVLVFFIGAIWIGQWYAAGRADEFAKSIHEKWANDNRSTIQQIERNRLRIDDLDLKFQGQIDDINKRRSGGGKVIDATIKKGDTDVIAGMFDNLIDRYIPPDSWDK